jgi:hypothetical protein
MPAEFNLTNIPFQHRYNAELDILRQFRNIALVSGPNFFLIYHLFRILGAYSGSYVVALWDIAPCSPYMNRRFGGTYNLNFQDRNT